MRFKREFGQFHVLKRILDISATLLFFPFPSIAFSAAVKRKRLQFLCSKVFFYLEWECYLSFFEQDIAITTTWGQYWHDRDLT